MRTPIFVLLLSTALRAQTAEGNVFDSLTGAPLAGALVTTNSSDVSRTDAAGHFRTSAPAFVQVSRVGYLSAGRSIRQGQPDVRIDLTPAAVISGKLTDTDGAPVEGGQVSALSYQMVNGERQLQPAAIVNTNDLGEYRVAGLLAGRYYIQAGPGDLVNWDHRYVPEFFPGAMQPSPDGLIELKTGEERGGVDLRFTMHDGVTVEGRLAMAGEAPIPPIGLFVNLQSTEFPLSNFNAFHSFQYDAFRIPHVPPGSYTLRAGNYPPKAGDIFGERRVEVGDDGLRDVVLTVREAKPVDISGTIATEDGRPARPVIVRLQSSLAKGSTVRSNDDGTFTLKSLLPAHYDLQVLPDITPPAPLSGASGAFPVSARLGEKEVLESGFDLDGASPDPLNIKLARTYDLTGKLLDASGKPVAGAIVVIASGKPGPGDLAITEAGGIFRVFLRTAGQHRVYVMSDDSGAQGLTDDGYLKAHENDFPPVLVLEGQNPPLTLRLPPKSMP